MRNIHSFICQQICVNSLTDFHWPQGLSQGLAPFQQDFKINCFVRSDLSPYIFIYLFFKKRVTFLVRPHIQYIWNFQLIDLFYLIDITLETV